MNEAPDGAGPDLAVVILTHNEDMHLARALASVRAIAREIIVVDSGSTDRTIPIAEAAGAIVLHNPWVNYARQFQWALDYAPISTAWVMRLDADEVIEPDLALEIRQHLPQLTGEVAGVMLKRKHIFMGRWIRHGGRYPLLLLRIWRRGAARIEDRWMDEHRVLSGGRMVTFEGGFADHNLNDLTFFTNKHNKYATREAIDVLISALGLRQEDTSLTDTDPFAQAGRKRALKQRLYNRMPFALGPLTYFLFRYVVQGGFRDGKPGLVYHALQGLWYRFLAEAKVLELKQAIGECRDRDEILDIISQRTGHDLRS